MGIDGKGQKQHWEQIRSERHQRLERMAYTPVGALYIRKNETAKQARLRILKAECARMRVSYKQFERLLELSRKRVTCEPKGKPPANL